MKCGSILHAHIVKYAQMDCMPPHSDRDGDAPEKMAEEYLP